MQHIDQPSHRTNACTILTYACLLDIYWSQTLHCILTGQFSSVILIGAGLGVTAGEAEAGGGEWGFGPAGPGAKPRGQARAVPGGPLHRTLSRLHLLRGPHPPPHCPQLCGEP